MIRIEVVMMMFQFLAAGECAQAAVHEVLRKAASIGTLQFNSLEIRVEDFRWPRLLSGSCSLCCLLLSAAFCEQGNRDS